MESFGQGVKRHGGHVAVVKTLTVTEPLARDKDSRVSNTYNRPRPV